MTGQAIVTIGGKQWTVSVATTTAELVSGLSGVASIPAGTGMLFDMGSDQSSIPVNMSQMLFALDIVFINSTAGVVGVLHDVQPGDEAQFQADASLGARYFLEVNAGEAEDIAVGDGVDLGSAGTVDQLLDLDSIMNLMITMMIVVMMMKAMGSAFKPAAERPLIYGPRGEVLTRRSSSHSSGSNPKPAGKVTVWCPICEKDIEIKEYNRVTRPEALRVHIEEEHRVSGHSEYYWEITDIETGEVIQRGKPYTSVSRVYPGARSYQRARPGRDKEHTVVIRIFDNPNMDEWGKTIKPVMESGMRLGIPILMGKTPLQEEALDRLWPYSVLEIHDDGDLTVSSAGKKYVVTTEGGVFVHYTGEEALGRIVGGE